MAGLTNRQTDDYRDERQIKKKRVYMWRLRQDLEFRYQKDNYGLTARKKKGFEFHRLIPS